MITKTKYFFTKNEYDSKSQEKNTIEEIKKDIIDFKKTNPSVICRIYKNEVNEIFDKDGELIYSSDIIIRQFNDDMEE